MKELELILRDISAVALAEWIKKNQRDPVRGSPDPYEKNLAYYQKAEIYKKKNWIKADERKAGSDQL